MTVVFGRQMWTVVGVALHSKNKDPLDKDITNFRKQTFNSIMVKSVSYCYCYCSTNNGISRTQSGDLLVCLGSWNLVPNLSPTLSIIFFCLHLSHVPAEIHCFFY